MATTTIFDGDGTDWTAAVRALGARTDNAGAAVDDLAHDEDRLINHVLTEGFLTTDAFLVQDGSTGMEVDVGSGTAKADIYVVEGDDTGQHPYLVRMDDATVTVTLDAGDADPRIDEIYLVVRDATYDGGSVTEAQIGYRKGDAAASPSAPGPDSSWDAEVLLATIDVAASASTVAAGDITDERSNASLAGELQGAGSGLDADLLDGVQLAVLRLSIAVVGTAKNATETSHSSARTISGTVDIPADWGSYSVLLQGSYEVREDAGSNQTINTLMRFNGVEITAGGTQGLDQSVPANSSQIVALHGFTGETATGTVGINIRMAPTGTVKTDNVALHCLCLRTS